MNLEELKKVVEKVDFRNGDQMSADDAFNYVQNLSTFQDTFNPSVVSKLLELFECAQHQVKHYPMHTNIGLIDAVRDLEQS